MKEKPKRVYELLEENFLASVKVKIDVQYLTHKIVSSTFYSNRLIFRLTLLRM